MVQINMEYRGDLQVKATHGPSGVQITTDAPVDNQGKGRSFSPTDLAATSLGACMMTIMGIVAKKHDWDLTGTKAKVEKIMAQAPARRIGALNVVFDIPLKLAEPEKKLLENAAKTCPVHHSLHPDININLTFNWA